MKASPASTETRAGTARQETREAMLHEFATPEWEEDRIEHVARRADCNRALLCLCSGDGEGFHDEAWCTRFVRRADHLDGSPRELGETLSCWTSGTMDDPTFIRMIQWESLEHAGGEPIGSAARFLFFWVQAEALQGLRRWGPMDGALGPMENLESGTGQ